MSATITRGVSYASTEQLTNTKLHNLVDDATITGIVNAEIASAAAIVDTKLAQIATADKVAGAAITADSVADTKLNQITTADKVSCSAITDIIFWQNIVVGYDNELVYF